MKKTMKTRAAVLLLIGLLAVLPAGCRSPESGSSAPEADGSASASQPSLQEGEIALESNEFQVTGKTVTLIGRHHVAADKGAFGFSNSAAGVAFAFEGTELAVYLSASAYKEGYFHYVTIIIDDREPIALPIRQAGWQEVATDLEAGKRHTVRILKRSESNAGDICIHRIRLSQGAKLFEAPPPPTDRKIQVLGDSIACGYGNLWTGEEPENVTKWEDGTNTYATMVAQRFGASLDMVAISGIGAGNAKNEPYPILPVYKQRDNSVTEPADFGSFVPDVVIIGLGTNDVGRQNPAQDFVNSAVELIRFIRAQHPDCVIIWTYGVMGDPAYGENPRRAVEIVTEEGMKNVYYMPATPAEGGGLGLAAHPLVADHERLAEELSAFITDTLGWKEVGQE